MPAKITEERIKTIAKKLNVCSTDLTPEELLDTAWIELRPVKRQDS
jgi:hypothetical protein